MPVGLARGSGGLERAAGPCGAARGANPLMGWSLAYINAARRHSASPEGPCVSEAGYVGINDVEVSTPPSSQEDMAM